MLRSNPAIEHLVAWVNWTYLNKIFMDTPTGTWIQVVFRSDVALSWQRPSVYGNHGDRSYNASTPFLCKCVKKLAIKILTNSRLSRLLNMGGSSGDVSEELVT